MIEIGSGVTTSGTGRTLRVLRMVGEGSQGVVFEGRDEDGRAAAIKWYYEHTATEQQRQAIRLLVERGSPS